MEEMIRIILVFAIFYVFGAIAAMEGNKRGGD
jgi:hypothetical protein